MDEEFADLAFASSALSAAVKVLKEEQNSITYAVASFKQMQTNLVCFRYREKRKEKRSKIFWRFPRCESSWLENALYNQEIPDQEFKKRLRISRKTFWMLVTVCEAHLVCAQTKCQSCLPPEKVLAVGLYRLAHGATYQVCADTFNSGKTTTFEAFFDVVSILNAVKNNYVRFPTKLESKKTTIATFMNRSKLPNILGAINGTHIKIKASQSNKKDYYSRYQQYDIVCQGVVDGNMTFFRYRCRLSRVNARC